MNRFQILFFRLVLLSFILLGFINKAYGVGVPSEESGRYAYAIRYGIEKFAGAISTVGYLDRIDTIKDEVVKTTKINPGYNSVSFLDDNRLLICNTEDSDIPKGADIFDIRKNKVVESLRLKGVCPKIAIPTKDKIFVITTQRKYNPKNKLLITWPSFEIFDRFTYKKVNDIDLGNDDRLEESISLSPDKQKIAFVSWNDHLIPTIDTGLIGVIDADNGTILKSIDYRNFFGGGRWLTIVDNRIYVTAVYKSPYNTRKQEKEHDPNNKLFVFNSNTLTPIKTIPIGVLAEQMTYVPSVNRLYISHSSWDEMTPQYVEVLDCAKDKVIAKIPVLGFRRMSYVGNNKLYISCSGGPLFGSNGKGGILVVDIRTNKILKALPGEYAPISYNFDIQ